jgi:hypothetical protein
MVRDYGIDREREAKNPCEYCPLKNTCFTEYTDVRIQCVAYKEFIKC